MSLLLGCIADDYTGATDLASMLANSGLRVVQVMGVPEHPPENADAVVVALKSRSIPASDAIALAVHARRWLTRLGAQHLYFKVCSTFDSTEHGNIGPVTDALMDAGAFSSALVCPALPANGRTVYMGHLFVGQVPLHESSMRNHPLTPMNDANLVRVMQRQSRRRVGLIAHSVVSAGAVAMEQRLNELERSGSDVAVVDAINDRDLETLAQLLRPDRLIVGGSGAALGLAARWGFRPSTAAVQLPRPAGWRAVIAGSCSEATLAQIARFKELHPGRSWQVDPARTLNAALAIEQACAWAMRQETGGDVPLLVYASASVQQVDAAKSLLGSAHAGTWFEYVLSGSLCRLVEAGARQVIVAGGETSGACVQALDIQALRVGSAISPGVPWCHGRTASGHELHLALKSGNFGSADFFQSAFKHL